MASERGAVYECPACCRVAPWTDGERVLDGAAADTFWCRTCGAETPLALMGRPEPQAYMALLEELTTAWEYGGIEGARAVELLERHIQAAVANRVAERCAPLVHALSLIADESPDGDPPGGGWAQHVARGALRAWREREGGERDE